MKYRTVDKILAWESKQRIVGIKAVSFEEYMLRSPLGYPEALPESLMMGSFLGLAEWLVFLSTEFKSTCTFEEISSFRFLDILKPGERLVMTISVEQAGEVQWVFKGVGSVEERVVAEIPQMIAHLGPLADRYDPEDLRVLFSEIFHPEKTGTT